jgi:7-cyano-7-deazaguanine synthase
MPPQPQRWSCSPAAGSTVALAHALDRYDLVETIGFTYGQRHAVGWKPAQAIRAALPPSNRAGRLGADPCSTLRLGQISDTGLTRDVAIEMTAAGLPNTFVPGRNLLFFTYAAALALPARDPATLVGGMRNRLLRLSGCRDETLQALARAQPRTGRISRSRHR